MRLSVELLDHIFSFLLSESHRETLFACSKDPVLSSIADKHFYSNIIVDIQGNVSRISGNLNRYTCTFCFDPDRLSKLVAENPLILNYVRVLRIQIDYNGSSEKEAVARLLNEFAKTLLMLPLLSSIILTSNRTWHWSAVFLAALEDRLDLPTLQELHLLGGVKLPFSVLDDCKNIKNFSLSRSDPPHQKLLSLEIDLVNSPYYSFVRLWGANVVIPPPELSPVSLNLQRLIIRTAVEVEFNAFSPLEYWKSSFPATVEVINSFISSPPHHLVLDISLICSRYERHMFDVAFSPLAVLGRASLLIPRIDLYVHTWRLDSDEIHAGLLSTLAQYEGIMRAIEKGVLVIHSEQTVPVSRCMV